MPGPVTHAAVTLLARDRLGQIRRALAAKKAAGTAHELELHVLHLATEAERMMSDAPPVIEPPVRLYGPERTDHVSRFTLLGAVGPDLPRYAASFAPGQRWLSDTLHKGTPDADRERVLANSTNLVFDFCKRVGPLIDAEFAAPARQSEALDQMRAYVLGHLCHVATDVLSHPYEEGLEAGVMRRDEVAGALDARVADTFFRRGGDTHSKQWADWFPAPGEVPASFAKAMAASVEALYGARAEGLPAFEAAFKKIDPAPPPLSGALIDESLGVFRTVFEIERVWTIGDWLGATAAMFLPMALAYPGALALPLGRDLARPLTAADGPDAAAVRAYESTVFPLAASALGPLVTMILVSASGRGLRAEGVTGFMQAGLSLVASIGFFASLGGAGAARWGLWFAAPLAAAAAQIVFVLARGEREESRKLLWLGPLVQVGLALPFMLLYRVWLHEGVEELPKAPAKRNDLAAFGDFAAWIAIVTALWFGHALVWRRIFSGRVDSGPVDAFAGGESTRLLRVYDDAVLVHDLGASFHSEQLADLVYPPDRRPLLKLWWEAGSKASVKLRVQRDRLVFEWDGGAQKSVFAPIAPTTVAGFGALVAAAVTGMGVGVLRVEPARDDEKDMELAPGEVFSDLDDDTAAPADHDPESAPSRTLGDSEAAALTVFHAPRRQLAALLDRSGVARDAEDGEADGLPYLADRGDVFGAGGSVMNDAADLATLLCLGAASRLAPDDAPVTPRAAATPVHRVYQVFRNWNLDRRHLNEWRLMVSGGAQSERRGDFGAVEEAAPVEPADAADMFGAARVASRRQAEPTVLAHGWLGVFRSWVDMASRADSDVTAPEVFTPGQPTNLELSRAMAYLLDAREDVVDSAPGGLV